ncbi:hypothetical protein ONE63_004873 [Megalurothrips usitatus]|uniref:Uncharacterized protein n=1 Tax=Megalurothrips usitatus TaxID=439358 RepID=A0AAV7X6K7_9NEOP|nr:hypothetical protein ONE63_004873 [Megalurothrips usitatus]
MLTGLLPAGWPRPAADHQYTAVLTLPPCADCSFRLVAAPAGWADVVLVNLSVLWGPGARAATSTSTYSLALPVGDYVVPQEDKSVAEEWPELRNVPVLAETVTSALSRPAICAARTAHAMVNPSLLGLPVRAAMRVLVHLPAADILRVEGTARNGPGGKFKHEERRASDRRAQVSASCRTLHSLATDAGLWRYVLMRDFGPLRGASKLHVPDDDHPVDWRAEYRRLYRARSALKIRRSELSGSNYLATPRPSAALHDGGLGVQRQQQAYAQSCSSLGLIREDDVVAAPEDSPSAPRLQVPEGVSMVRRRRPPWSVSHLAVDGLPQPTAPCLQSFYGGGVGRTPSSKSTVSRVSSNRSSHVGGLRRPAAPPPSKAKTSVAPVAAEEVVKVGSKVYKALLSYRAAAAPKPQQEKTAAPPAGEHPSAHV